MNWLQKLFQNAKEKSVSTNGGIELLTRLVSPELGTQGLMERYRKSLYVFACISKIAEKVGSIEINLNQIMNSKGDMKQLVTHPALDLIYRPNKLQTKSEFLMTTIINKKTAGDAFIYKVRNNSGRVVELWNLRPDLMTIITDPVRVIAGYKMTRADGKVVTFEPDEIIHFKDYPDPLNSYSGVSALMPASIRVQTEEFATRYQRDFFLNSARPDAVLKSPKKLLSKQKAELKKNWNRGHQGIKNSSKIGLLEGGIEYQLISLTQKDMDYIEGIKMTRDDILVAFRMTKTVLGITEDVNRANSEAAMYVFLSEVIVPEMRAIIEKLNEEMLYPDFGENLYYSFVDPTPANRELQLKEYTDGLTNNWLLINEVRQKENLPPVKGGWSIYMPIMNTAVGGLSAEDQQKMIKRIEKDSDFNEKIIEAKKKSEEPKYNFKGRNALKEKLNLYERIAKEMIKTVVVKKKGKKEESVGRPMLENPEVRKMYAEMVNKKIDAKSMKLKEGMDDFAIRQKARVVAALAKKAKQLKKKLTVESIFNKSKEETITLEFIVPYIEEFLKEAGLDSLNSIAPQEVFTMDKKRIQDFIKKRAEMFAESVNNTTLEGLDRTLSEGLSEGEGLSGLMDRVESVYEDFPLYRSELIARTEATAANNEGILESFKQSEIVNGKEWINAGDGRVRIEHQNKPIGVGGEIVLNDKKFSNGLQYPSEPNCRCVLGGAFIE
jgi:HK97 family phage portal protein